MKITIRLRPDRDDDIKKWYQSLPRGDRSRFIRDVLKDVINHKKGNGQDQSFDRGKRYADAERIEVDLIQSNTDDSNNIDTKLDSLLNQI